MAFADEIIMILFPMILLSQVQILHLPSKHSLWRALIAMLSYCPRQVSQLCQQNLDAKDLTFKLGNYNVLTDHHFQN